MELLIEEPLISDLRSPRGRHGGAHRDKQKKLARRREQKRMSAQKKRNHEKQQFQDLESVNQRLQEQNEQLRRGNMKLQANAVYARSLLDTVRQMMAMSVNMAQTQPHPSLPSQPDLTVVSDSAQPLVSNSGQSKPPPSFASTASGETLFLQLLEPHVSVERQGTEDSGLTWGDEGSPTVSEISSTESVCFVVPLQQPQSTVPSQPAVVSSAENNPAMSINQEQIILDCATFATETPTTEIAPSSSPTYGDPHFSPKRQHGMSADSNMVDENKALCLLLDEQAAGTALPISTSLYQSPECLLQSADTEMTAVPSLCPKERSLQLSTKILGNSSDPKIADCPLEVVPSIPGDFCCTKNYT